VQRPSNFDASAYGGDHSGWDAIAATAEEEWGIRRFFVRDPNGAVLGDIERR
jgi:hypothetical protein